MSTRISELPSYLRTLATSIDANHNGAVDEADVPAISARIADDAFAAERPGLQSLLKLASGAVIDAPGVRASSKGDGELDRLGQLLVAQDALNRVRATLAEERRVFDQGNDPLEAELSAARAAVAAQGWSTPRDQKDRAAARVRAAETALASYDRDHAAAGADLTARERANGNAISAGNTAIDALVTRIAEPRTRPLLAERGPLTTARSALATQSTIIASHENRLVFDASWFFASPESNYADLTSAVAAVSQALSRARTAITTVDPSTDLALSPIDDDVPAFLTFPRVLRMANIEGGVDGLSPDYYMPTSAATTRRSIAAKERERDEHLAAAAEYDAATPPNADAAARERAEARASEAEAATLRQALANDESRASERASAARDRLQRAIEDITDDVLDAARDGMRDIAANTGAITPRINALNGSITDIRNELLAQARGTVDK